MFYQTEEIGKVRHTSIPLIILLNPKRKIVKSQQEHGHQEKNKCHKQDRTNGSRLVT